MNTENELLDFRPKLRFALIFYNCVIAIGSINELDIKLMATLGTIFIFLFFVLKSYEATFLYFTSQKWTIRSELTFYFPAMEWSGDRKGYILVSIMSAFGFLAFIQNLFWVSFAFDLGSTYYANYIIVIAGIVLISFSANLFGKFVNYCFEKTEPR